MVATASMGTEMEKMVEAPLSTKSEEVPPSISSDVVDSIVFVHSKVSSNVLGTVDTMFVSRLVDSATRHRLTRTVSVLDYYRHCYFYYDITDYTLSDERDLIQVFTSIYYRSPVHYVKLSSAISILSGITLFPL